jgi:hypothetical protein
MIRNVAGLRFALALVAALAAAPVVAQDPAVLQPQGADVSALYTVDELDNLLAPVALYPDPILAQLLVAATFPDQIALAARYVRTYGTEGIDDQAWDVSVKSIAHYEPVLNMLADRPDWSTALGQAYALQPGDVMASVQGLREMARAQGNLVSTAEQRVVVAPQAIQIVPAQPTVIYVPTYDPAIIYYQPVYYARYRTPSWSFGIGFPIGVWLTYDLDWGRRVVYYHGWNGYGRSHAWYNVSRPYIEINNYYVGSRFSIVVINRNVVRRHVSYGGFDRYNTVHRRVSWDRPSLPGRGSYERPARRTWGEPQGVPARRSVANEAKPVKTYPSDASRTNTARTNTARTNTARTNTARTNTPRTNASRTNAPRAAVPRTEAKPSQGDRVTPVRIGGNSRPLYPSGANSSPDRVTGTTATRQPAPAGKGTWNARPAQPARNAPSTKGSAPTNRSATPARTAPRYTPAPRVATTAPRSAARPNAPTQRTAPRAQTQTRTQPSAQPRSAPRSAPQASKRAAPTRSAPSASKASKSPARSGKKGS